MNQELIRKQQDLTARLNRYRHEYYNLNAPNISDAVYDRLFEELQDLERHPDGDLSYQYGGVSGNQQAGENQPSNPAAVAG